MTSQNAEYYDNQDLADYFEQQEDFEADKPFYLELLGDEPQRVLEVGSGTGRLARVLSRAGHAVIGVEQSSHMIEVAERYLNDEDIEPGQRPTYLHRDILSGSPPGEDFDFVLVPEYTFGGFLDRTSQDKALRYCHTALKRGGTLVLHLYLPNPAYFAALRLGHVGNAVREEVGTLHLDDAGEQVAITKTNHYSRVTGEVSSEVFYDLVQSDGPVRRSIRHVASHAFTPLEISLLLENCGFRDIHMYGDFDGGPLAEDSHELIVTARRGV